MTQEECREALTQASLARLGCERDGQAYVVPVFLCYDGRHLYGFSTLGQKINWMRSNSRVCVQIDDIKSQNRWMSVVVYGRYEELSDTPEHKAVRSHAHALLQKRAMWWEPGSVAVEHRDSPDSVTPVFYRIHPDRMTGHRASPDTLEYPPGPSTSNRNWLSSLLRRVLRSILLARGLREVPHGSE